MQAQGQSELNYLTTDDLVKITKKEIGISICLNGFQMDQQGCNLGTEKGGNNFSANLKENTNETAAETAYQKSFC